MVTHVGSRLFVATRRLARESIVVRIVGRSRRMPIVSGLVHASRVVNRGVYGTPGDRSLIHGIRWSLLCLLLLTFILLLLDFLFGGKVDARQVYPQALSNPG